MPPFDAVAVAALVLAADAADAAERVPVEALGAAAEVGFVAAKVAEEALAAASALSEMVLSSLHCPLRPAIL